MAISATDSRRVWVNLWDSAGFRYKGATVQSVNLQEDADVDDLRDAVKAENPNKLSSVGAAQLKVYRDADHFNARDVLEPMLYSRDLKGLGESKEKAMIVLVPNVVVNTTLWYRFVDSSQERDSTLTTLASTVTTIGEFEQSLFCTSSLLHGVFFGSLNFYKNISHYSQKSGEPLESTFPIQGLGQTKDEALIVWFPVEETILYRMSELEKQSHHALFMANLQLLGPPTTTAKSSLIDKRNWRGYYGMQAATADTSTPKQRYCHLLGTLVPSRYIACSHLFQRRWGLFAKQFGLNDIHAPDNILFLLKIFKDAFERGRILFLVDKSTKPVTVRFKVLDGKLRSESLQDSMKKASPDFAPGDIDFKDKVCFGDLDGQELQFLNANRPRTRFLLLHAQLARKNAVERGWIREGALPELDNHDYWMEEYRDCGFVNRVKEWIEYVPPHSSLDEDDVSSESSDNPNKLQFPKFLHDLLTDK